MIFFSAFKSQFDKITETRQNRVILLIIVGSICGVMLYGPWGFALGPAFAMGDDLIDENSNIFPTETRCFIYFFLYYAIVLRLIIWIDYQDEGDGFHGMNMSKGEFIQKSFFGLVYFFITYQIFYRIICYKNWYHEHAKVRIIKNRKKYLDWKIKNNKIKMDDSLCENVNNKSIYDFMNEAIPKSIIAFIVLFFLNGFSAVVSYYIMIGSLSEHKALSYLIYIASYSIFAIIVMPMLFLLLVFGTLFQNVLDVVVIRKLMDRGIVTYGEEQDV